jgi:hypothetical protein
MLQVVTQVLEGYSDEDEVIEQAKRGSITEQISSLSKSYPITNLPVSSFGCLVFIKHQ